MQRTHRGLFNQGKHFILSYIFFIRQNFYIFTTFQLGATERGVMVIKSKDKTRASQRKGALSNWKVGHLIWSKAELHDLFLENWENCPQVFEEERN